MRAFCYCRISTPEQTFKQQLTAITNAGYQVEEHRVINEVVSGTVCAMQRPEFSKLVDKLERDDVLVISKLDRLGRDNIDIQQVVKNLTDKGIKLVILDLPVPDLSSSNGQLMLQMFASFAEFERNRISERTKEKLAQKVKEGAKLGRPTVTTTAAVKKCKSEGLSQSKTATSLGISIATVKRHWNL